MADEMAPRRSMPQAELPARRVVGAAFAAATGWFLFMVSEFVGPYTDMSSDRGASQDRITFMVWMSCLGTAFLLVALKQLWPSQRFRYLMIVFIAAGIFLIIRVLTIDPAGYGPSGA